MPTEHHLAVLLEVLQRCPMSRAEAIVCDALLGWVKAQLQAQAPPATTGETTRLEPTEGEHEA